MTMPASWYGPPCVRCGEQCTQCWFQVGPAADESYACFACVTDDEIVGLWTGTATGGAAG